PCAAHGGNWAGGRVAGTMRPGLATVDQPTTRIAAIRAEIDAAARRVGRDPAAVRIVGVTKTLPPDAVIAALDAGIDDIGENYVQEAERRTEDCASAAHS